MTAALAGLLLCALLVVCSRGSLTIINHRPPAGRHAGGLPSWEPWCTRGRPREERKRLAFCARVEGRVLSSTHGPAVNESHVAVISDFHVVIVKLPEWLPAPKAGTQIVAIGPLFRARDGQREIQAFRFQQT